MARLNVFVSRSVRFFLALPAFWFGAISPSFSTTQICKLTCTPDPSQPGYDTTVVSMTDKTNVRGNGSVYGQAAAGSSHGASKVVPGSQSYDYVIPVLHLPGRNGLDLNLTLFYNSRVWTIVYNGLNKPIPTFNPDHDFPSYGFRLGFGFLEYTSTSNLYTLVEADGTKRKLSASGGVYVSQDSSFIQWTTSSKTLLYKNGTRVTYEPFPTQNTLYRPTQIRDSNGNFVSITYHTESWAEGLEINTITDTVGRTITFNYDSTTHALTSISQGATTYINFQWNSGYVLKYNFSTFFAAANAPANNSTISVLSSCTYPNSTSYVFTYGDWGVVKKIEFKSSNGTVRNSQSYDFPLATSPLSDGPTFATQTIFDGVNTAGWTYSYTKTGTVTTSTSITDPYGTVSTTNLDTSTGLPTSFTITPSGQGVLRTTSNTWSTGNNPTLSNTVSTLNDSGQQSKTAFLYDAYDNVTEVQEYDFGMVYKRRTVTSYSTSSDYTNLHILNLPTQVKVYDEAGGESLKGRADFAYDEYTPSAPGGTALQWDSSITGYRGNPTTVKRYEDPVGPSGEIDRHFLYDQLGNLIQADLDCCTSKSWTYDSTTNFSYPVQVTSGSVTTLTTSATYYTDSGLSQTVTDENNQTTTFSYDSMFRLTDVQRPDGIHYGTSFDDASAFPSATSSSPIDSGITANQTVVMDGAGRPIQRILKDGSQNTIRVVDSAYDLLGRLIQVSNPHASGVTPVYTTNYYDALSRVTKIVPPDGTVASNNTTFSFSSNSTTVTDPAGKQRRNYSDAFGRLVEVDEPSDALPGSGTVTISGTERSYTFNPCQNNTPPAPTYCPATVYDAGTITITVNGFQTQANYGQTSTAASLASVLATGLNGASSPVTASANGAVITLTSKAGGVTTNYTLSAASATTITQYFSGTAFPATPSAGTLTGGSDHGAGSTSLSHPYATVYSYDVRDKLVKVTQGAQQRTFAYNGFGNLTSAQTPESGTTTFSYVNGSGNRCSTETSNACKRTDARNVQTTYTYDGLNRLTGISYNDSTPGVTYVYDAGGAPAFALGRLTSMTDGLGSEAYTYDQFGHITHVTKIISGNTYNLGYTYDYVGDIKTITDPTNAVVTQGYDAVGRLNLISGGGTNYLTVPSNSYNAASLPTALAYGNGVTATIGYNTRLQLSSLQYAKNGTDLLNLTYNYNQTVGGQTVNNGQLQGITDTRGAAYSETFSYDALGRLLQGQTNDLSAPNTWKLGWSYDRYGNRTAQNLLGGTLSVTAPQLAIDPVTNRITTAGYSYDTAGNLTNDAINTYAYDAENRIKTATLTGGTATYSYDGKGQRAKKVTVISGVTTTMVYVFSGTKVVAEYVNGSLSSRYIYAGSQLLATIAGGAVTYHHPDHLSARVETNSAGTVTRTFGHLPFGETWYETGTAVKWKFTSYERDAESGLDYATFRYDSARLGRFLTTDPMYGSIADPQSLNRYSYVGNDPCSSVDPLGLDTCTLNVQLVNNANLAKDQVSSIEQEIQQVLSKTQSPAGDALEISFNFDGKADTSLTLENAPWWADDQTFGAQGRFHGPEPAVYMDNVTAYTGGNAAIEVAFAAHVGAHELGHQMLAKQEWWGYTDQDYDPKNPNIMMFDAAPDNAQLDAISNPNSKIWQFTPDQIRQMFEKCRTKHPKKSASAGGDKVLLLSIYFWSPPGTGILGGGSAGSRGGRNNNGDVGPGSGYCQVGTEGCPPPHLSHR